MVRLALATVAAEPDTRARAAAQVPTQDSVSGSGALSGDVHFTISATSGPSGGNPAGHVDFAFPGPLLGRPEVVYVHVSGEVTCLNVHGNRATLQYFDTTYAHIQILVEVIDNAGTGQLDVLDFQPTIGSSRSPTDCSPAELLTATAVHDGDLAVVDAQPPPTSKEQCKQGGYRQFGFKNQGQCVAFVNHPPKS